LDGYTERDKVEQGGYPAVEGVVVVALLHVPLQIMQVGVLLLEWNILDEGNTPDVEEDSHEGELDDAPGREHHPAQRQLRAAHRHFSF